MQQSLHRLVDNKIEARDGNLGKVSDFYFDDEFWIVRYMVIDTEELFKEKKVLVSPIVIGKPDLKSSILFVDLTIEQIQKGPDISTKRPLSREDEIRLFEHYSWPFYWKSGLFPGDTISAIIPPSGIPYPSAPYSDLPSASSEDLVKNGNYIENENNLEKHRTADPHLRSVEDVRSYGIHAIDGDIGHVEDLIIDDEMWDILYLVIDTRNWILGKKIVISPRWIKQVNWVDKKVVVDLPREAIKNSPEYHASTIIDQNYKNKLKDYYAQYLNKSN
ncbi:MAG: hypothetical protein HQK51_04925 [Oligoflexia bacterium]|nr:hypothetical protein [Oligoflexia bacterium]